MDRNSKNLRKSLIFAPSRSKDIKLLQRVTLLLPHLTPIQSWLTRFCFFTNKRHLPLFWTLLLLRVSHRVRPSFSCFCSFLNRITQHTKHLISNLNLIQVVSTELTPDSQQSLLLIFYTTRSQNTTTVTIAHRN
jgi:hypothetical protein